MSPAPPTPGARQPERYEPLPGLLGLPRFVWRKLPRAVQVALMVLGAALVVGTIIAIPLIASGKREGASRERRAEAAIRARELRRVRSDQVPRRGRAGRLPAAAAARR